MKKTIMIEGMSCHHCTMAVENALKGLNEVLKVEVSLEEKKAVVEGENLIDDKLRETIEEEGYKVVKIN
ncbi:heavy-metal-associated domain-containing protein [Sporanaerobacter acetigenes]|uniref:Heavy-metal-associated domain-containing protein n=1 Tax=Sporanaerobacter acetigenes DSM 13106 TaxID=1123281 RepID=A0A1M5VU75_9FIRM|nr:cation transporter [Sporanaerobacter acetigenes]SHH78483.1 Heavy-metal-associated domain-containing protein [Sporanaerobacter acetigenes DSM 13106]